MDGLVERLLEEPPGPHRERLFSQLDPGQRTLVSELLDAGDLVWEAAHGAPALEDDPVAAMLGLVPDPAFQLDSAALSRACAANRVKPTALAARLNARGWKVAASDVFRWQTRPVSDVSPALVRAIAVEVGVDPERLVSRSMPGQTKLRGVAEEVTATSRFRDLVQRFAKVRRIPADMAETALRSRMLATVHRGDAPDAEQMLASIESLVRALETDQGR